LETLLERFEHNLSGFQRASRSLGANPWIWPMLPLNFCLFPGFPYIIFWLGDDESLMLFKVLFDRSIETYFSASGIWLLVNLVSFHLL
jgi:hypothetical protein